MQSGSPPRKKLKQARLPFQILSPKKTEPEHVPTSRKRPLSEAIGGNSSSVKLFKASDDLKENKSLEAASNIPCTKNAHSSDDVLSKSPELIIIDGPNDDKKPCDKRKEECYEVDCEDLDSAEEVLETQVLESKKLCSPFKSISSSPPEESKSEVNDSSEPSVPLSCISTDSSKNNESLTIEESISSRSVEKDNNDTQTFKKSILGSHTEDGINPLKPELESKSDSKQMNPLLSLKTYNMFAKWKKVSDGVAISPPTFKNSPEKAVEAVEEISSASGSIKCDSPSMSNLVTSSGSNELEDKHVVTHESKFPEVSVIDTGLEEAEKVSGNDPDGSDSHSSNQAKEDCLSPSSSANSSTGVLTPKALNKTPLRRLTPKQVEKEKERKKKQEEKEKVKLERLKEKQRLKDEKDELKKKEKEEKEELKRKEKEEKERKRQTEIDQKNEEKKKKEELKAEEKKKRDDKRKADEEEERKKARASALFTSFFVPKQIRTEKEEIPLPMPHTQNFMPFEVKADMRVAPRVRVDLSSFNKELLDKFLADANSKLEKKDLYVECLKGGKVLSKASSKTWPIEDSKDDDNDICVLEQNGAGIFIAQKKREKMRAKCLQFHENQRPAYWGTWRKKSFNVTGRRPFGHDKILDYEVDSDDEWEEEEPGESLHGSDDDKEQVSEDEYEVDNSVFVPHGYLSDDEGDAEESSSQVLSPETQKAKLKLLGEEFEAQMKSGTSSLKPLIIFLTAAMQADACKVGSSRYQKLVDRKAVWAEENGPIVLSQPHNSEISNLTHTGSVETSLTGSCGPRAKKRKISEEAIPALITLVHGNLNKRSFLVKEFSSFLQQCASEGDEKNIAEDETADPTRNSAGTLNEPNTPHKSCVNPLVSKWSPLPQASKVCISDKIKEIAVWKACPEEGPMYNRYCWFVSREIRDQYGMTDLKLPNNAWVYILKPKVSCQSGSPSNTLVCSASESKAALITKFTKIMTPEEKQRQWDSMKTTGQGTFSLSKSGPSKISAGKITAFTSQAKLLDESPGNGPLSQQPSSQQTQLKKRVPLLKSVPRGQQITSHAQCSLLSKFEASATSISNVKVTDQSKQSDIECVVLD